MERFFRVHVILLFRLGFFDNAQKIGHVHIFLCIFNTPSRFTSFPFFMLSC